jgi:hypothetical protein
LLFDNQHDKIGSVKQVVVLLKALKFGSSGVYLAANFWSKGTSCMLSSTLLKVCLILS